MQNSVVIKGGRPLNGQVSVQGSKNAALPILGASLLMDGCVSIYNVPELKDIRSILDILSFLDIKFTFDKGVVTADNRHIVSKEIGEDLSNRLRASVTLLGPLLARFGQVSLGLPGGCAIGSRPIDIHLDGFEKLGAEVVVEEGMVRLKKDTLKGEYTLRMPSVGATQNLIMASVLGESEVTLRNIAREPEIFDLIHFLRAGGANITLTEDGDLNIFGVPNLSLDQFQVQPDRIEAGTLLIAGLISKGDVTVTGAEPKHLSFFLDVLREMNAGIEATKDSVRVFYQGPLVGAKVKTAVYPGFPTDLQSQLGVLMTQASTSSLLTETIFENRFSYVHELHRMNANVRIEGQSAFFDPSKLSGCRVQGFDLRGTASMVLAGLCAEGVTRVEGLEHLHRGYESFIKKLGYLGASIVPI
jgi:UDP-N-acetylglucosamine 1-carboxyvinyltransferase